MEHSSGELLMNLFRELYHPPVQRQQQAVTSHVATTTLRVCETVPPRGRLSAADASRPRGCRAIQASPPTSCDGISRSSPHCSSAPCRCIWRAPQRTSSQCRGGIRRTSRA
eukprot:scaffold108016_cov63-Phaeocystis_antarctica.AAC.1